MIYYRLPGHHFHFGGVVGRYWEVVPVHMSPFASLRVNSAKGLFVRRARSILSAAKDDSQDTAPVRSREAFSPNVQVIGLIRTYRDVLCARDVHVPCRSRLPTRS